MHHLRDAAQPPGEQAGRKARERRGVEDVRAAGAPREPQRREAEPHARWPAAPAAESAEVRDPLGRQPDGGDQWVRGREHVVERPAVRRRRLIEEPERAQHPRVRRVRQRHDRAPHALRLPVPARSNGPPLRMSSRKPFCRAVACGMRSMAQRRAVVFATSQRASRRRRPRDRRRPRA